MRSQSRTNGNLCLITLVRLPQPILLSHKQHTHYTNDLGITPLAFVPKSLPVKQSGWPTLGEMIDSGKRVIVFLDSGADTVAVDFILPEFQMVSCSHDVVLPFIGR